MPNSQLPWFAVRVKSQCERSVAASLRQRDYEEFLPMYWSRRRWSDRVKMLQLPLFAGYLFCRFDPSHRSRIVAVPGVVHVAGVGSSPLPVPSEEIEAIRQAVDSAQEVQPWNRLQVGHVVRIEQGPLTGLTGMLVRWKNASHLVLNVQLLQRGVAVEVDERWVVLFETNEVGADPYAPRVRRPPAPVHSLVSGSHEYTSNGA